MVKVLSTINNYYQSHIQSILVLENSYIGLMYKYLEYNVQNLRNNYYEKRKYPHLFRS